MCLAVLKNNAEGSFSVEDFRTSFHRNSDGTGIAYIDNGRIVTEKAMGSLKEQLDVYYRHMHRPQFILHQRLATHGEKSVFNVHPFYVLNIDDGDPYDLVMAHNGIVSMTNFDAATPELKRCSDTQLLVEEYLKPLLKLNPELIRALPFQKMLHDFIGTGNKLVFLRNDGETWIFNKSQGTERNGCWLSNSYSVTPDHTRYNMGYAKNHGANAASNVYSYRNMSEYAGDYDDYNDNAYFREPYNRANRIKTKSLDTMSQLDADTIIEAIDTYSGLPTKQLEALIVDEPFLSFDMINFLSVETVEESIINDPVDKLAEKLFDLMQEYCKRKAA